MTGNDGFDWACAPMRIGRVRLKVRDLPAVAEFYRTVLGLHVLAEGGGRMLLGAPATPLLDLVGDPALTPRDPRDAGLFHTAFLLPSRADLARWLASALARKTPIQGAADHGVSEAIYLADPEGNGIEIYRDRPVSDWRGPDGGISMTTEPLRARELLAEAGDRAWSGFPDGGFVGHVHLQVGDTAEADRFYLGVLGFDRVAEYPGASFYGSGGYHHQLAGNVWNSRRAGPRPERAAGLDAVEIVARDESVRDGVLARAAQAGLAAGRDGESTTLRDPWGTAVTLSV